MQLVFLLDSWTVNAWYRVVAPMRALEAMGHEVREATLEEPRLWDELLRWCDLLLIHRSSRQETVRLARRAKQLGVPIVWDDDDDLTKVPKGSAAYRNAGGLRGQQLLRERAKLFELVDLVTTPSDQLGRSYLRAGARDVCVIENYVIDEFLGTRRRRKGTWIGWVASEEHRFDLQHIPIADALARLLDAHKDAHVMTIGIQLPISHPRYVHEPGIPPRELLHEISTFDVGIAPLSTKIAINHSRSNVKLKEYAAVGVPWLASPIGPYVGFGEDEGGRLVDDDRWFEELDALVSNRRQREKLAKQAAEWGEVQLITENIEDWEEEFSALVENSRQRRRAS